MKQTSDFPYNPYGRQKATILGTSDDGRVLLKVDDLSLIDKCKSVFITPNDTRQITSNQRRMVWALIGYIAEWQGESKASTMKTMVNEAMKYDFLSLAGEDIGEPFSLSNAPMSLVREYQKFLIDFIVENDIQTDRPLYEYVDDNDRYIYSCLAKQRCCVCGKKSDLHHCNIDGSRVGMGRDRRTIIHEGLSVLPLCREHHNEIHTMPENEFFEKYHISPIKLDKNLCRRYGLHTYAE